MSRYLTLAAPFPFLAVLVLFFMPFDEYLNGYEIAFGTEIKIPRSVGSEYRLVKIESSPFAIGILLTAVAGSALAYSKRYRIAAIVGVIALCAILVGSWLSQRAFDREKDEIMRTTGTIVCDQVHISLLTKTCLAAFLVGAGLCGRLGWAKPR